MAEENERFATRMLGLEPEMEQDSTRRGVSCNFSDREVDRFHDVDTPSGERLGGPSGGRTFQPPMKVKARTYSGEGSWREYFSHFERVCNLNQWDGYKLDYLWVNLTGTALSYAESLPVRQTRTYEDLCKALNIRFGEERLMDVFKAELRARRRQEEETLPALGQDIRRLVSNAYPDLPIEGVEELAVEKFREALTDRDQRMAVHRARPRHLEEAVQAAMDMEAWQVSESRREGGDSRRRVRAAVEDQGEDGLLQKLMEKMELLEKRLDQQGEAAYGKRQDPNPSRSFTSHKPPIKCFSCGKEGHISRVCPDKKARGQGKGQQLI